MEESKDSQSSQQNSSVEEKKVSPPPAPVPRPVPVPAARPPAPPPAPASRPPPPKDSGRRTFMKLVFALMGIAAVIPFVPWGSFLSSTVSGGTAKKTLIQKVRVDNLPDKYGTAAGQLVNVNNLTLFPPNGHWVVTYPSSGDPTLDAENPDTFQKYELIRLPDGTSKKATDFVAFSKVCVHLWCSPNYIPSSGNQDYECPCHGSKYRIPDGKAYQGPASIQAFPANAIPMLTLQADSLGNLYIYLPNHDPSLKFPNNQVSSIEANGDLGFGRDYQSYDNFIKKRGEIQANPLDENVVVS